MTKSSDVWLAILKAEDKGETTIREALDAANRVIEEKRQEAAKEVDRIRKDHADRLTDAKAQSDESVNQLQQGLQLGQQEKKRGPRTKFARARTQSCGCFCQRCSRAPGARQGPGLNVPPTPPPENHA
jgi:vacuolar-type H+-ATPase subunit H